MTIIEKIFVSIIFRVIKMQILGAHSPKLVSQWGPG